MCIRDRSKSVQAALEKVAREAARKLGNNISVAMIMADARTGEVLARVGSSDYFDASRSGWIDMTKTTRSPGSTLKPFIYGLAFEQGMVCLLYTSPSPRDRTRSRLPSSACKKQHIRQH